MNNQTYIFIGRSASGKGTQINKMIDFLKQKGESDFFHLEAGNSFREFISRDGYSEKIAREISEKGELQPEFLSIWAWGNEIVEKFAGNKFVFIDGTPRRLVEAKILESALDFYNLNNINIIYLQTSRQCSIDRMKNRKRKDDIKEESIQERMNWFEREVSEVVDYYRAHKNHNFIEIDGEQSIEKVHQDIIDSIDF
ncbi:MAG: adenylate kinase family protein [Bacteriovoracia bacterium]